MKAVTSDEQAEANTVMSDERREVTTYPGLSDGFD
jgi:hypothetical protein